MFFSLFGNNNITHTYTDTNKNYKNARKSYQNKFDGQSLLLKYSHNNNIVAKDRKRKKKDNAKSINKFIYFQHTYK